MSSPTSAKSHANQPPATAVLSILTGIFVAILAAGAFALSFDSLNKLAVENGVTLGLTWVWPLVLDGSIVVFSLSAMRSRLHCESVTYPMCLVVLSTMASVVFNVAHALEGILPHLMASVPPIALFLSFELLMRQVGAGVERNGILSTLHELKKEVTKMETKRTNLTGQIEKLIEQNPRSKSRSQKPIVSANDQKTVSKKEAIMERQKTVIDFVEQKMSVSEIAQRLDVSTKTVKRDIQAAVS